MMAYVPPALAYRNRYPSTPRTFCSDATGDDDHSDGGGGDGGSGDDGGGDDGSGDIATHARPSHVVAGRGHLASSLWQLQLD